MNLKMKMAKILEWSADELATLAAMERFGEIIRRRAEDLDINATKDRPGGVVVQVEARDSDRVIVFDYMVRAELDWRGAEAAAEGVEDATDHDGFWKAINENARP